ncbi:MAG: hypothetical protein SF187_21250 [Deltaproteobacteria bacterium]|nr:hypothetical protein [Deltaproteobacteria bacterium]
MAECRVRGCTRTWTDLSSNPKLGDAGVTDDTKGMCESCRRRWPKLADKDMPCAREGCEGTWRYSRESQLEHLASGRPDPKHFCGACDEKLKSLETVEATCAVPGCGRTARLTPKQQLLGDVGGVDLAEGGITYTGPLCKRCAEKGPYIKDVAVACGIQKCKRTWTWKADEQMQAFASGKPNIAPRRMCDTCRDAFGKLLDRDIRCRASGCKKTWQWTREQQLDAAVADKPLPKPPSHLCTDCFKIWSGLKDEERPCRRSGCKNTWTEKRGAQLARILRGKTGEPFPQFCASCAGEVEHLKDREVPCKSEGCKRTWTWTAQQQFIAGVRPLPSQLPKVAVEAKPADPNASSGADESVTHEAQPAAVQASHEDVQAEAAGADEAHDHDEQHDDVGAEPAGAEGAEAEGTETPEGGEVNASEATGANGETATAAPTKKRRRRRRRARNHVHAPSRHCGFCTDFLAKHKTIELPCASCGTPIFWPPESQLQTELGNWEIPKLCGACKRDATEAERIRAKEEIISHAPHAAGSAHPAPQAPVPEPETPPAEAPSADSTPA